MHGGCQQKKNKKNARTGKENCAVLARRRARGEKEEESGPANVQGCTSIGSELIPTDSRRVRG